MKISKAYEVLTNDATRENYEKCVAVLLPFNIPLVLERCGKGHEHLFEHQGLEDARRNQAVGTPRERVNDMAAARPPPSLHRVEHCLYRRFHAREAVSPQALLDCWPALKLLLRCWTLSAVHHATRFWRSPRRYGNPDGYHGTSVTIGLPSWLTDKDNELAILVAYFVALIVVIPTVVGLWCATREYFAWVVLPMGSTTSAS